MITIREKIAEVKKIPLKAPEFTVPLLYMLASLMMKTTTSPVFKRMFIKMDRFSFNPAHLAKQGKYMKMGLFQTNFKRPHYNTTVNTKA